MTQEEFDNLPIEEQLEILKKRVHEYHQQELEAGRLKPLREVYNPDDHDEVEYNESNN